MPTFVNLDDDTDLNLDDVRLIERHHPPLPGPSFTVITFCNGTSKTVWGHLYARINWGSLMPQPKGNTLERNLENEIDDKEEANP